MGRSTGPRSGAAVGAAGPLTPHVNRRSVRRGSAASSAAAAAAASDPVEQITQPPAAASEGGAAPREAELARRQPRARAVTAASQAEGGNEEEHAEEAPKKKRKGGGGRREPDPPPVAALPTREMVERLQAQSYAPPPLPSPNLGYACLNQMLRALKPPVFTSRDCIKRTLEAKGLAHLGELALANCRDLSLVLQWNAEHGIRFFRMSSVLFPWMGTYEVQQVPQYGAICDALQLAGDLARIHGQRLTFHPSHFVKLATTDEELATKSIKELEAHSQIFNLMGYQPSANNKINIHVGGVYSALGSKEATMRRWAANFERLSPSCRARMTVENDDIASAFSLEDLLFLHQLTRVPLVFDFHHHRFCPGSLSEQEALEAAVATWPPGVRPVVHWSESQEGRKPHAHSDWVRGPINLHGLESKVDVMIEAKCKEQALLAYRGDVPFPEPSPAAQP